MNRNLLTVYFVFVVIFIVTCLCVVTILENILF